MTSHFLSQDLKHINSKLTYQCDVTQKRDFLIIHSFSLMVNQTSEFQALGSGSTFKRSFVSHHPTLGLYLSQLNPAHVITSSYCPKAATLISSVQRMLGCDAASLGDWFATFRRIVTREWPTILRNVEKHSLSDTAFVSQKIRIISNNDTRIPYLPTPRFFSPASIFGEEYELWSFCLRTELRAVQRGLWMTRAAPKSHSTVSQTVKGLLGHSLWVCLSPSTVHVCHSPCVVESPHNAELLSLRQPNAYYGQRSVTRLL
jgi:hypothetical protein